MFGLLNINKPAGWTSRQVVNTVQRLAGTRKVGHAGTLDPLATGVLVVCIGPATRLADYVQKIPKRYRGTFLLGRSSASDDTETEATVLEDAPTPSFDQIRAALPDFTGKIQQRPPEYSAIKVGGRRAYEMARQGQAVQLAEREVAIHALSIVDYRYPELTLEICCGAGTYVRSLGRDLARQLGTAAVMSALERTAIGGFTVEDAVELEELEPDNVAAQLLAPGLAVVDLPRMDLSADEVRDVTHGRPLRRVLDFDPSTKEAAAFDTNGQLLAILNYRPGDKLSPKRVFGRGEAPAAS